VPIGLTALAFAFLYITMPNRRVLVRDALSGGFLAAFAFEGMKHGFAFYITQFPTHKLVYGAFASVPIFLLWVYLSWVVVLSGAIAAAIMPEWRERTFREEPGAGTEFLDALQILRLLWAAHRSGEIVTVFRLHTEARMPIDRVEALLDAMAGASWTGKVAHGWTLIKDAKEIRMADVYHLFVFQPDARPPVRKSGQDLDRVALDLAGGINASLQLSLEALFERAAGTAPAATGARIQAIPAPEREAAGSGG